MKLQIVTLLVASAGSTWAFAQTTAGAQVPKLRAGVSVQMAASKNAQAVPDADKEDALILAITENGTAYLGVTRVAPGELTTKVKASMVSLRDKTIYLKGDARARYSDVSRALDALPGVSVEKVILLTQQNDGQSSTYPVSPKGLEVAIGREASTVQEGLAVMGMGEGENVRVRVGGKEVPLEALAGMLRQEGPPAVAVVSFEEALTHGSVVKVIDEIRSAGSRVYLSSARVR